VKRLLQRKAYAREDVNGTLARLTALGYLDDLRYASGFVATVARAKAWGPHRVRAELARRGVDRETVDTAMARAAEEGGAPEENLDRALAKLLRAKGIPADRRGRDRLKAALMRQGFASTDVRVAVAALSGDIEAEPEEIGREIEETEGEAT
jgi:regulatory protein